MAHVTKEGLTRRVDAGLSTHLLSMPYYICCHVLDYISKLFYMYNMENMKSCYDITYDINITIYM